MKRAVNEVPNAESRSFTYGYLANSDLVQTLGTTGAGGAGVFNVTRDCEPSRNSRRGAWWGPKPAGRTALAAS